MWLDFYISERSFNWAQLLNCDVSSGELEDKMMTLAPSFNFTRAGISSLRAHTLDSLSLSLS